MEGALATIALEDYTVTRASAKLLPIQPVPEKTPRGGGTTMEKVPLRFIQASLVYGLAGGGSGIWWLPRVASGGEGPFVHLYLLAVGWMGMLACGIAYHVLPRFVGRPLHSRRMAVWHFYLSNLGAIGVAASLIWSPGAWPKVTEVFAGVVALGLLLFALNLWRTLSGPYQ